MVAVVEEDILALRAAGEPRTNMEPLVKVEVAELRLEMGLVELRVEVGVVEVAGLRLVELLGVVEIQVKVGVQELQYMSEMRPVIEVAWWFEETEGYVKDFQEVAEAVEEL